MDGGIKNIMIIASRRGT